MSGWTNIYIAEAFWAVAAILMAYAARDYFYRAGGFPWFYLPWQFIPMQEATTRAYEQLRKNSSLWSAVADRFSDSNLAKTPEEGTLLYIATAFTTQKVPLYGKHPPSRLYELIDQAEFSRGRFQNSGAVFQYVGKNQPPLYCDIAIKASDLRKAIAKMKKDSYLAI